MDSGVNGRKRLYSVDRTVDFTFDDEPTQLLSDINKRYLVGQRCFPFAYLTCIYTVPGVWM